MLDLDVTDLDGELEGRGIPVPFFHRNVWRQVDATTRCVGVRSADGRLIAGCRVRVVPWRALPGHATLRVLRLRPDLDMEGVVELCAALRDLVRGSWRYVRLHVEAFSLSEEALDRMAERVEELGFEPAGRWRQMWRNTVLLDLGRSEEEMLASFKRTARVNIKEVLEGRRPVAVGLVRDPALAPRLKALVDETMARGGRRDATFEWNWEAVIRLSAEQPDRARVVGLLRRDMDGPEALVAFVVGLNDGDHVHYAAAASTRLRDVRVSLGYAPTWDLIRWARGLGVRWFDFGGVATDVEDTVSDFKRRFGPLEVRVGDEWLFDPRKLRARVGDGMSRLAHGLLNRARLA